MFFDNDTALGEPSNDPGSDITADEFRAASCIGSIRFDGTKSTAVGNGLLYNLDSGPTYFFEVTLSFLMGFNVANIAIN